MKEPTKDQLRADIVRLKETIRLRDKQLKMMWKSRAKLQGIIHDMSAPENIDTSVIDAITVEDTYL